ncbi:MAG: hypothetical protein FJY88_05190 [Candidatus Eisenbacteria bacterium]|nr:hypothetical protein [Candidatus Eisenbacteria bacterium]
MESARRAAKPDREHQQIVVLSLKGAHLTIGGETDREGRHGRIQWPDGKSFAFSIFDDTDNATVQNVGPIYDLLSDLGLRTTKSVWPLRSDPGDPKWGQSLEDDEYLDFILELKARGFEIGYHGARIGDNPRSVILEALDLFRQRIGHDPKTYAQHSYLIESLYWGKRQTRLPLVGNFVMRNRPFPDFLGDDPKSPYFWGDLCKERIAYVRCFEFSDRSLLESDRWTPYHDPQKPYVNFWFSANGGGALGIDAADEVVRRRIHRWEESGALILVSAHLAQGLVRDGKPHPGLARTLRLLSESAGWFAPVGEILDHVRSQRGPHLLTRWRGVRQEVAWVKETAARRLRRRLGRG